MQQVPNFEHYTVSNKTLVIFYSSWILSRLWLITIPKGYWASPRKQQQTLRCANSSDFFRREKTRPHHKVMNCFWFQFRFTTQNSYQTSCWTQGVLEMWEKSRKRKELKGEFIHCLIHNCECFGKVKWNSCKTDTSKTIINTYTRLFHSFHDVTPQRFASLSFC